MAVRKKASIDKNIIKQVQDLDFAAKIFRHLTRQHYDRVLDNLQCELDRSFGVSGDSPEQFSDSSIAADFVPDVSLSTSSTCSPASCEREVAGVKVSLSCLWETVNQLRSASPFAHTPTNNKYNKSDTVEYEISSQYGDGSILADYGLDFVAPVRALPGDNSSLWNLPIDNFHQYVSDLTVSFMKLQAALEDCSVVAKAPPFARAILDDSLVTPTDDPMIFLKKFRSTRGTHCQTLLAIQLYDCPGQDTLGDADEELRCFMDNCYAEPDVCQPGLSDTQWWRCLHSCHEFSFNFHAAYRLAYDSFCSEGLEVEGEDVSFYDDGIT